MSYTEFRKSYGDFEVIIPAVHFGYLTLNSAVATVKALRAYKHGFVCDHLGKHHQTDASECIGRMLIRTHHSTLGGFITTVFTTEEGEEDGSIPVFGARNQSGITLRKAWCEHMANEIEREFGFTHW